MMKIVIDNTHELTKNRIWYKEINLHPGLNLLFGGNGAGKTSTFAVIRSRIKNERWTRLKELPKDSLKITVDDEPFKGLVYTFSNSENNASRKVDDDLFDMGGYGMVRKMQGSDWSEGMNVSVAVYDFLYALEHHFEDGALVLVDEIDSGLDAHSCSLIMKKLCNIMKKKPNIYVLLAFNQYEMARTYAKMNPKDANWINIYTGQIEPISKSYEEYFELLKKWKQEYRRIGDELAWGESEDKYHRNQKKIGRE